MTDEEFEGLAKLLDATVRIKHFKKVGDYGYQVIVNSYVKDEYGFTTRREAFDAAKEDFKILLKIPFHADN
jgi:hypothetical protein